MSEPIRCLIVDDEPLARINIEVLLEPQSDFLVQGSVADPLEALERAVDNPPDLIFLDVRMPELSGMHFLERLRNRLEDPHRPYVILVTAFDHYALQAFEYEALDYLVKPFDDRRFGLSLDRARKRISMKRQVTDEGRKDTPETNRDPSERLSLKVSGGLLYLFPQDICWIESADHYLMIHTKSRTHLVRATMSSMEKALSPHGFVRVHRGALIRLEDVVESVAQADGGRLLLLREGSQVRASRRRWPQLRDALHPSDQPD